MDDPQQAWADLSAAVTAHTWEKAAEIAENLTEWLSKGGFPPRITRALEFDRLVINAACQAIATWELV